MDTQKKATARPWKLNEFNDGATDVFEVQDATEMAMCHAFDKRRAKTIIRAVNSHDALLEACKEAYEALGKDNRWNISDLRLKVLGQAINQATETK